LKSLPVAVLALLFASAAFAQRESFVVNPDASQVKMTLNTTHEIVHGTFHVQSGSVEFAPGTSAMSGDITVAAAGDTGNGSRDHKMNKDILRTEQYATVTFQPKSYTGALAASGDSTIQVSGIFTLLGTPHEITVPMQVHLEGSSVTAKAHFVVPYVQWGLKNPSFLIWKAENDVAIDLDLAGNLSAQPRESH